MESDKETHQPISPQNRIATIIIRPTWVLLCFALFLSSQISFAQDIGQIILNPTWSPNGEYISYMASDGIYVMDKNGDNERLLVPPRGFGGWTADSDGILIIENKNPSDAAFTWWIYPIDGDEPVQFLPQLYSITALAYSQDGKQMALSAQENPSDDYVIWVANADGSDLQSLAVGQTRHLRWSEDVTQIIFETMLEKDGNREFLELAVDLNVNVISLPRNDVANRQLLGGNFAFSYDVNKSYSPTTYHIDDIFNNQQVILSINQLVSEIVYSDVSHTIAYVAYCDGGSINPAFLQGEWSATEQENVETALYLVDTNIQEQQVLIPCGNSSQIDLSISPNGKELLFVTIKNGEWDIKTHRIVSSAK